MTVQKNNPKSFLVAFVTSLFKSSLILLSPLTLLFLRNRFVPFLLSH